MGGIVCARAGGGVDRALGKFPLVLSADLPPASRAMPRSEYPTLPL